MTREEKTQQIEELVEKLSSTEYFYITDASGMSVAQTTELRRACFKAGVEYKVYKNTLIKKAMDSLDADYSALDETLKGFSGIMFSPEVSNGPAKLIKAFRKDTNGDSPLLKGAYIDSDCFVGNDQLDTLANLKSKNELIAEVIALLQSPAKNVISALQSGGNTLSGLVKALQEREG